MGDNLPAIWLQKNNGNKNGLSHNSDMNKNVHTMQKQLIIKRSDGPPITIPELKPLNKRSLTKDYSAHVDEDFKTRGSQLPNSYFKDMPKIIRVNNCEITSHYIPGFVSAKRDLHDLPRNFEPVQKKNEFGFDRTMTKEITSKKIAPQDVTNNVSEKNKFNDTSFTPRELAGKTPIVPVNQERKKILIKK